MFPAVFLDRDGVIIENYPDYVRSWADVVPLPGTLTALARLAHSLYKIVIVTNQSAIGRGLLSLHTAEEIHARLVEEIEKAGGRIDGSFLCPHRPEDDCSCRKPRPGLFFQAMEALNLDLGRSIMIGDTLTDLKAAQAAGVPRFALVRTGLGEQQAQLAKAAQMQPFPIYNDLAQALSSLVETQR
jgi:D-glycero-D-manno-heptose 1,7-bisphosphate phosphatase